MNIQFLETIKVVSSPSYLDAWWVDVNGERIPQPETLGQALLRKPPRSRAKVLLLHTSLSDEWIPIRELESLVSIYAFSLEREEAINKDLAEFHRELDSEVDSLMDTGAMLRRPAPEERKMLTDEASQRLRRNDYPDVLEMLRSICPNCFHPLWVSDPDLFEEAAMYYESFTIDEEAYEVRFLSEQGNTTIDEVLNRPSMEQLVSVLSRLSKANPNRSDVDENGSECACNRRLAKAIAKQFPGLVKSSPEAQGFFNPERKAKKNDSKSVQPPRIKTPKKGKKQGRAGCLFLILILVVLWAFNPFCSNSKHSESKQAEKKYPPPAEKSAYLNYPKLPEPLAPITTLANVNLPVVLVSTEEFFLLDKAGKQTTIPAGSIITVESRGASGTLTARINGETFVGNEERLAGKAKMKAD